MKPMLLTSGPFGPNSDKYAFIRRSVGPRSSATTSIGERNQ
jgi:hypothetical protein